MKKITAFMFSLIFAAIALTACGSTANAPSNTDNASDTGHAAETATPSNTGGETETDMPAATADGIESDMPAATGGKAQAAISEPDESAKNEGNTRSMLSENEAKEIALKDAGVNETAISNYKIKLDTDDGIKQYEIDFDAGGYEYDYEIDAVSGQILEKDKEPID